MVVWSTSHQGRFDILTMMGLTRVTSIILHLHVHAATYYTPSLSRHYYPQLIDDTNLLTPRGWIAW